MTPLASNQMTFIPVKPITGSALRAAFGELIDFELDEAAAICGYVDDSGCPDIERFKEALLIHPTKQ